MPYSSKKMLYIGTRLATLYLVIKITSYTTADLN